MKGQVMANIIKFPNGAQAPPQAEPDAEPEPVKDLSPQKTARGSSGVVKALWVVTVLLWPWVKWLVSLDVLFQFVRMIYHWNTPGSLVGWNFLLHFAVLTALTYFVSAFKPKGL